MNERAIEVRQLDARELSRVREIDRTERIDALYVQHGTRLEERVGDFSSPNWDLEGSGEYSVAALLGMLEQRIERGATAVGAFAGDRLVGFGVVLPHIRPSTAQLVALYVSDGHRGRGIGGRVSDELERIAREAGDREMVVSATPSANTVHFYQGRGFVPSAEPLPELFELEPEDVHLHKRL
jgi:GNAT superfamily N-acetyltransferase